MCETHDMVPLSEEEQADFDAGNDPCIQVIRFYGVHKPESINQ